MDTKLPPTYTIMKQLGETPLEALERLRRKEGIPLDVPLAYAGRLDPMATGKLLLLVGDECKEQERYHGLDKEYVFETLCGVHSDSGDVLGIVTPGKGPDPDTDLAQVCRGLCGTITLPYPHFSSKTVHGKPLHTWTLENRLHEITIPTKESVVYALRHERTYSLTATALIERVSAMINSIPAVTDPKKALGADFRRHEVRGSWQELYYADTERSYLVHQFRCIASSGTYMRSLAEVIGTRLGCGALALSIERTRIGRYRGIPGLVGFWTKTY
jgi:tRNA U55 pseudouridine synthase TruB